MLFRLLERSINSTIVGSLLHSYGSFEFDSLKGWEGWFTPPQPSPSLIFRVFDTDSSVRGISLLQSPEQARRERQLRHLESADKAHPLELAKYSLERAGASSSEIDIKQ
jgi:hypothetical protein